MINQATLDYLKGRVISTIPKFSGDITTTCLITFDNGSTIEGASVRDINGYDKVEAESAAYTNAIASLAPGIDFFLSKK